MSAVKGRCKNDVHERLLGRDRTKRTVSAENRKLSENEEIGGR